MQQPDVIIIGAGAAGLMCAITAGQRGRRVLVLDHANKVGKKILMSGGGRCNFTNTAVSHHHFISHNPDFCRSALSRYTPQHFIALVQQHRIPFFEKTLGQLFCERKSKDIVNMLLDECQAAGVQIKLNTTVTGITHPAERQFTVSTDRLHYQTPALVIASGGLSIPTLGASAFGYKVANQFGITVWPTRAALVAFTLHPADKQRLATLSGISVDCVARCHTQQFRENLLFTHRGLSGPAMLQISSYWRPGEALNITLLPDLKLYDTLKELQRLRPQLTVKNALGDSLPKRLLAVWLDPATAEQRLAECSDRQLRHLVALFQEWHIKPNNTEGYRTAEVTLGGVDCHALSSKTFETQKTPGLYFIGEVVDVTGWLGGYNFQWAWASGAAAGNAL